MEKKKTGETSYKPDPNREQAGSMSTPPYIDIKE